MMTSEVLNVVIDERKQLDRIAEIKLSDATRRFADAQAAQQKVFKDYILSSEIFYIDNNA